MTRQAPVPSEASATVDPGRRDPAARPSTGAYARRAAIASALVVALALSGCAARRGAAAPASTTTGTLRVGTSGDYPPFSIRGADGDWSGFDVEVARAYASARGRPLVFVPFRWPDLAHRLAAGDFDVAMSGVTVRADRLLAGTLTAAVARSEAIVLTRRGGIAGDRLDRPATRVAVNRGGHLERVARARLPHATIVAIDDNRRLPELLASGAADAVVTDTLEAVTFGHADFVVAARLSRDRKAYWVAPGEDALAADLDAWLLAAERDGTLARLRTSALGTDIPATLPPELARAADLAARRLLLMPDVAAAKRAAGLPIVDTAREADVVARAVARAGAAGLDTGAADHLARAAIMAARAVQEAARPPAEPRSPDAPTLATLRPRIDALDEALVRTIVAARRARVAARRGPLATALLADADLVGFDEALASAIAAAIAELVGNGSATIAP